MCSLGGLHPQIPGHIQEWLARNVSIVVRSLLSQGHGFFKRGTGFFHAVS